MKGCITALITPFKNGSLDLGGLKENIAFQLASKVDGLLALGTTAETPTLSDEERYLILKTTVEMAKGKAYVLAGCGSNSTKKSIEYTLLAQEVKADGALIVTPYYNCPTQEGILAHFKAIAQSCDLPLWIYNIPKRTGCSLTIETLRTLCSLPSVVAVKQSNPDLNQLQELLASVDKRISVFTGDDAFGFLTAALGGAGLISVASNLVPQAIVELISLCLSNQYEKARAKQFALLPLIHSLFIETNPGPIKTAMSKWGLPAGELRLPLSPMQPTTQAELFNTLAQYEQLKPHALW